MSEPFVAWPGWKHLRDALWRIVLVNLLFVVVYGGADWITAHRAHQMALYAPAELAIPLWPPAIVVYDSLYLLFCLAPFVLRTAADFRRLALTASLMIIVAGACFLLVPAKLGFPAPVVTGPFQGIFEVSDRLNLDYNLVPSLHVALTTLCVLAFWPRATSPIRAALVVWAAALAASTLVTHQHHLLDVVTGVGVAWATWGWMP